MSIDVITSTKGNPCFDATSFDYGGGCGLISFILYCPPYKSVVICAVVQTGLSVPDIAC